MKRVGVKLAQAVAIAGVICGLAASPALADRDHHHERDHHWRRPPVRYYRGYDRRYYYAPQPEVYYAPPPIYVPAPPSRGLTLIFPFRIR